MKALTRNITDLLTQSNRKAEKSTTTLTEEIHGSDAHILSLLRQPGSYDRGFRLLVQQYRERLYFHVKRMVGSHADADDVLQNTFIKVYRSIARFEEKSKLYTWLYRIATNESLTFLEKRNRKSTDSLDDEEGLAHKQISASGSVDATHTENILARALATLPAKQKAVFNLRYYDEMSYADMADALQTSQGALKASYHHAVKKVEAFVRENVG